MLRRLSHQNIIGLLQCLQKPAATYLIMDYCAGGDLFSRVESGQGLHEIEVQSIARDLLGALHHIHSHSVAHRDVKPQNCLLLHEGPIEGNIMKLLDFGTASGFDMSKPDVSMDGQVGSPYYVAPEVLLGAYGPGCDLWSTGVLLFVLLSAQQPFGASSKQALARLRQRPRCDFSGSIWKRTSSETRAFLDALLEPEPNLRPDATKALQHHWLHGETVVGADEV